jgi:hypothetical protein|tara:strand:- start:1668 stop:1913 length:246 start_codon:yes stop_codon:yes gene_type:complete
LSGKTYQSFRLIGTERVDGKVKQHTLINLGRFFDVPQAQMSLDRLYQVSDQLWKQKEAIEAHLYQQEPDLLVSMRPSHSTI